MCGVEAPASFVQAAAAIAQLGERQTEDLKVPGSVPGLGIISGASECKRECKPEYLLPRTRDVLPY